MKAAEFVKEDASGGSTSAGSIAPVATPLGMIARTGGSFFSGKYTTDPTPNTPVGYKKYKRKKTKGIN
jgi:hypothetical protein